MTRIGVGVLVLISGCGFRSLGILNIFACLPQMVGSFVSFLVFSAIEPGRSPEFSDGKEPVEAPEGGINAIAVCMAVGAGCTLVAAWYTLKFRRSNVG